MFRDYLTTSIVCMLSVGGKQVPRTQKGGSVDVDFFDMGQTKKTYPFNKSFKKHQKVNEN